MIIYADILGFENLAWELAQSTSFRSADEAREHFLSNPMRRALNKIQQDFPDSEVWIGTDDCLIFCNLEYIYPVLTRLISIDIPITGYSFIPFAIATDLVSTNTKVAGLNRDSTIQFLKADVISPFMQSHKKNSGVSLKKSFILCGQVFYQILNALERKEYNMIDCSTLDKPFYLVEPAIIKVKSKLLEFVAQTGLPDRFQQINDVYVPPMNYDKIKESLKNNKIVFITGSGESGKTWTAAKLLWEFQNEGYQPEYFAGRINPERLRTSFSMANLTDKKMQSNKIIYFEDPFGKIDYEKNEILEEEMSNIFSSVSNSSNLLVIVTSRDEVFREFQYNVSKRNVNVSLYNQRLSIDMYDYEKRIQMLTCWAESRNCIWLPTVGPKRVIFDQMADKTMLPTPLNIHDFAVQSSSTKNINELTSLMQTRSEDTVLSFSQELETMPDDRKLFLTLVALVSEIEMAILCQKYAEVTEVLQLDSDFQNALEWFRLGDKIELTTLHPGKQVLRFSHPSYLSAFSKFILGKSSRTDIDLLSSCMSALKDDDVLKPQIISAGLEYFSILSQTMKQWLIETVGEDTVIKTTVERWVKKPSLLNLELKKLLKNEGILPPMILSGKYSTDEIVRMLGTNIDWDNEWQLILELESEGLQGLIERLMPRIVNLNYHNKTYIDFCKKMISTIIDEKIMYYVRDGWRTSQQIFAHILEHPIFSHIPLKLKKDLLTDHNIQARLRRLTHGKKSIRRYGDQYRASKSLILRLKAQGKDDSFESVFKIIEGASKVIWMSEVNKNYALEIAEKIRLDMQGRRPKAVAAGILGYLRHQGKINSSSMTIAETAQVNPATVIQATKDILKLLKSD